MTSHPFLYTLIHFTFISTSNEFAAMKGSEGRWKDLLERGGICFLQWQLVVHLEYAGRGYIAIIKVIQNRNNNHFHLVIYTHEALCNWCSNRLTHA